MELFGPERSGSRPSRLVEGESRLKPAQRLAVDPPGSESWQQPVCLGAGGVLADHPGQDGRAHADGVGHGPLGVTCSKSVGDRRIASTAGLAQFGGERPQLLTGPVRRA